MNIINSKNKLIFPVLAVISMLIIFSSCDSIGLMNDSNSWLPHNLDSISNFFKAYITLQFSMFLVSLVLGIFIGKNLSTTITVFLHWLWLVEYRDYGFWMVILLFFFLTIVTHFLAVVSYKIFGRKS